MKKVCITGATGFVGSHLAEAVLEKGVSLKIFTRKKNKLIENFEEQGAEIVVGTFEDDEKLAKAVDGCDTVIHAAGATKGLNESDYIKTNSEYTENILKRVDGKKTKFIYISTQAAAGPSTAETPKKESDRPNPLTFYGKSKLLAEEKVKKWGSENDNNYTILRPSSVFGPREKDIYNYFKLVNSGVLILLGSGKKRISIVYVKDLVKAIIASAESTIKGGVYFIANDESCDWIELGTKIKIALNKNRVLTVKLPEFFAYPVAMISDVIASFTKKPALLNNQKVIEMKQTAWLCSNDEFKKDFGWKSDYDLSDALKETASWYKNEGWL